MNSVNIIDPQVFIKCLPPPVIPSHKGVKIQARSATVYNATIPTRDEVRRENFKRRQMQMSHQGFKSPIYLPYQGIGEPISLDDKRLILAAIGYRPEDAACEKLWHLVDDNKEAESKDDKSWEIKPMISSKRVLLRSSRKLNTLNQAVVQGRILVRNVRLGRGYFNILKEQEKEKRRSFEQQERERSERAKFQWRNPKYENSESESDPECEEEKNDPLVSTNQGTTSTSTSIKQNRRKRSAIVRPYTPLHTNMAHCSSDINSDALFRQLCVLLWLLEATNIDSIHCMIPIHSCWKIEEICSSRSNYRKNIKPRWDSFINNTGTVPTKSFNRSKQHGGLTRRSSSQRSSFTPGISACTTPDQGSLPGQQEGSVLEESMDLSDEDVSQQYSQGNLSSEFISDPTKLKSTRGTLESSRFSKEAWKSKSPEKTGQRKAKQTRPIGSTNEQQTQEQLSKLNFSNLRPKSSPAFFHRGLNTQLVDESLIKELREKFEDVKEEKALTLHESLERLEKECLLVCESKYQAMSIGCTNYHQALAEMRNGTTEILHKSKKEIKNDGNNWFTQLELSIPPSLKNIWYYEVILNKLSKFGVIQIASKFGKFLKVLSSLQPWQICSPDISAAIEFFRAKIIEMTVEEYERWFQQQFPAVYRPETAPVKSHKENKKKINTHKRPVL